MDETGRITTGTGLATAPILHVRAYLDAIVDIHTRWYTFNTREWLLRDTGTADNQVMWVYGLVWLRPAGHRPGHVGRSVAVLRGWQLTWAI